jgi:gluconate 5-dehydrogenase
MIDRPASTAANPIASLQAFSLANRTALITGGGTGIGLAVARCMTAAGARVVLIGRRAEPLREAAESIGPAASWHTHNITRCAETPPLIERIVAETGGIDILVNNAGMHLKKPAVETTEAELLQVFNTHVTGAFALARACIPGMVARGGGSIIFIASMAAVLGIPLVVAYSTAKSGLLGMTRSLAAELAADNVRVNAIAPGWIHSDMLDQALDNDPKRKDKVMARIMLGRLGEPEDIGWAATYLCSDAARYVTGVCLPVDGGGSIGF